VATILQEPAAAHGSPGAGPGPGTPLVSAAPGAGRRTGRRPLPRAAAPLLALGAGIAASILLLAGALHGEFPLFAEASAERGRDCTTVASARHALDAALESRLPLRTGDADGARAVRSAVAAFDARTSDLATASVAAGIGDVRSSLTTLLQRVQQAAAPGAAPAAASGVEDAVSTVRDAWTGRIARVCS
jgi:hypothetical protein